MKIKQPKTRIGQYISLVVPLIEEIVKDKMMPICVLGFAVQEDKKIVRTRFATLNDEHDKVVYQMCKAYYEQAKHKYEAAETENTFPNIDETNSQTFTNP